MDDSGYEDASPGPVPGVRLDHRGLLDQDSACRGCGYNLRGLDPRSTCPECGRAVSLSLGDHLLRHADPAWVRRLNLGADLLLATLAVIPFLIAIVVMTFDSQGFIEVLLCLYVTMKLAHIVGVWLLTTPEPSEALGPTWQLRVACRWLSFPPILLVASVSIAVDVVRSWACIVLLLIPPLGLGFMAVLFAFLLRLADRLPDDATRRDLSRWGWGALICAMTVGASIILFFVGASLPAADFYSLVAACTALVGTLGSLACATALLVVLASFASQLRYEAYLARLHHGGGRDGRGEGSRDSMELGRKELSS